MALSTGTPSITTTGATPRNSKAGVSNRLGELDTFRPAIFPVKLEAVLAAGTLVSPGAIKSCTAYPNFFFSFLIPKAVTTISSSTSEVEAIVTFITLLSPTTSLTGVSPT